MNLQELMQNPGWQAFLAFLTIFATLFAVWSYIKSRKRVELSDYCVSRTVISEGKGFIPDLQMVFRGKPVDRITATRFALWNSGTEKLARPDMVDEKHPRVYCTEPGAKILDATIVKETEETNHFTIEEKGEQEVRFSFEYLNRQDGIVVQIVHTGHSASLAFDYKLKGGTEKLRPSRLTTSSRYGKKHILLVIKFLSIMSLCNLSFLFIRPLSISVLGIVVYQVSFPRLMFGVGFAICLICLIAVIIINRNTIFSPKIPKTLLAEVEFKSDDI